MSKGRQSRAAISLRWRQSRAGSCRGQKDGSAGYSGGYSGACDREPSSGPGTMSQAPPPKGESSEPAKQRSPTLSGFIRAVVKAVHRLDLILCNKTAYQEGFKPENISLRNKL